MAITVKQFSLYAKAFTALATSAVTLTASAAVDGHITGAEWLAVAAGVLVTSGAVFGVPNAKYPADPEPVSEVTPSA